MAFRLSFELQGVRELSRVLAITADSLTNFKPMFEDIAKDFRESEAGLFENEGAFEGNARWKELSSSYQAWKSRKYPGRKILELTGALRKSLTQQGGMHVSQPTNTSLRIGTRVGYAMFHQNGTSKMPSRPPIAITTAEKSRWTKIAHKYIVRSMSSGERASFTSGSR